MAVKPKRLGHLVLRVRDLERSEAFYKDVLGLDVTTRIPGRMVFMSAAGDSSHELGLAAIGPNAAAPDPTRVGLYHFAWQMDTFEDLQRLKRELPEHEVPVAGIGDHGISIGVYFFDPDGNEIEAFYELPKEEWPESNVFAGSFPRSLDEEPAPEPA